LGSFAKQLNIGGRLLTYRRVGTEPTSQPQVSADGKFYWDGTAWRPFATQQAPPQPPPAPSNRGRNLAIGCLGTIGVIIVLVIIGNLSKGNQPGGNQPGGNQSVLKWDVSGRSTPTSTVGGSDAFQITVTNNGPDASDLILYVNAKDDWLKHHVVLDPGGCTINKSLERLECGPLQSGETRTINIEGQPKDAGNFDFEVDVADDEGSQLSYPDKGALVWSETVAA
jgi:hypothetical protein